MRFLREAAIAAMLVACNDESSAPTQPTVAGASSDPELSSSAVDASPASTTTTRGFFVGNGPTGAAISLGTGFSVIQKMSLPAGSYVATVSAVLSSNDPEARLVDCVFAVGGITKGQLARSMVGGLGPNNFVTIPNTVVFAITTRTNLAVACRSDIANRVVSQPSPLTAIRVGSVTVQRE
jgi:hypothetical protein